LTPSGRRKGGIEGIREGVRERRKESVIASESK
jgi:hypothetical protein